MALSAAIVWEVRDTGDDANGGGFDWGALTGTDYSQQDTPQLAITDLICAGGTTTCTSVAGGFTVAMNANLLQIISGTNFVPGFYTLTGVSAGGHTITLDRDPTNGSAALSGVLNLGGALALPTTIVPDSGSSPVAVYGNKIFCKGSFALTQAVDFTNISGSTPPYTSLIGYGSTRGGNGQATFTFNTGTYTNSFGVGSYGGAFNIENLTLQAGTQSLSFGTRNNIAGFCGNCIVTGSFSSRNIINDGLVSTYDCEVDGNSGTPIGLQCDHASRCFVKNATQWNFYSAAKPYFDRCVSSGGAIGFYLGDAGEVANCDVDSPSGDGIVLSVSYYGVFLIQNNVVTNCGGYGINNTSATAFPAAPNYDGNAFYNNTSGNRHNLDDTSGVNGVVPYTNQYDVILTGSPYVNTSGGDFTLNNTAGAGAACKGAGVPVIVPGLSPSTHGNIDMGVYQSLAAAGGGTPVLQSGIIQGLGVV